MIDIWKFKYEFKSKGKQICLKHTPESGSKPVVGRFFSRPHFPGDWRRQRLLRRTYVDNRTESSTACRTRTISSAICVRRGAGSSHRRSRRAFSNIPDTTNCRSKSGGRWPGRRPAGGLPIRCAPASRTRFCFPSRHRRRHI